MNSANSASACGTSSCMRPFSPKQVRTPSKMVYGDQRCDRDPSIGCPQGRHLGGGTASPDQQPELASTRSGVLAASGVGCTMSMTVVEEMGMPFTT